MRAVASRNSLFHCALRFGSSSIVSMCRICRLSAVSATPRQPTSSGVNANAYQSLVGSAVHSGLGHGIAAKSARPVPWQQRIGWLLVIVGLFNGDLVQLGSLFGQFVDVWVWGPGWKPHYAVRIPSLRLWHAAIVPHGDPGCQVAP